MDPKQEALKVWNSKRVEGISIHFNSTPESRTQVVLEVKGSVDLPGDLDYLVSQLGNSAIGLVLPKP